VRRIDTFDREADPPRRRRAGGSRSRGRPERPELPPALTGQGTELTIVAQDPSIQDRQGGPLLSTVKVPAERVLPGPRDHRFFVLDYDPAAPAVDAPVSLTDDIDGERDRGWRLVDRFSEASSKVVLEDRAFHAQNVFTVAVWLLSRFEEVLGRRIPWGFGSHHLYLVPHAFVGANAGYSPEDHSISFGYVPAASGQTAPVFSCLSHDVIAHELTHAILDGLRPRYIEPGLPDQLAFHEGFADIIALLAVFSRPEVVARLLAGRTTGRFVPQSLFDVEHLKTTALFGIGEELGATLGPTRRALRRSLADVPTGAAWRGDTEPHRRGEVLVAAVSHLVATLWSERLEDLGKAGKVPLARGADEGAKVADHVMGMCIRALDYLPPLEFEFEDFLDGLLTADEAVAPDDPRRYRDAVKGSFARYDLHRPHGRRIGPQVLRHPWRYQGTNSKALATSPDEVYRFVWQNADNFGLSLDYYLAVERVLSVTRTGPDGLVVEEIIADYVQTSSGPLRTLPAGWRAGVDAPGDTEVQVWGGGVIVFDQYGVPRHHVTKPLVDPDRQRRRLSFLAVSNAYDSRRRLGFSYGVSTAQQFQQLHAEQSPEGW
jgi:hypothetical protein